MRFPARCAWFAAAAAAGGTAARRSTPRRRRRTPLPRPKPSSAPPPPTAPIPRVAQDGGGAGEADVSLALAAPPRVSRLTVSGRVFPGRPTLQSFPFVLAADRSGLLLLSAILTTPLRRVVVDRPGMHSVHWEDTDLRYYVLDAATGAASLLPNPAPQEPIEQQALVGVLPSPGGGGGGGFMVAELLPLIGSDTANLRCYSSDVGEWVDKCVRYPLPPRPLEHFGSAAFFAIAIPTICTVSHQGRLWWVDYPWGIITADPFADHPVLRFVPLPRACVLKSREAWGLLDQFRYVGVSAGKLRFAKVTVWTLPDRDATEWKLEHEANFADIWADDSYEATGLPKKPPVLALIHPHNPAVVYFFLEGHLFAVDVPARKVVECDRYHLVAPPSSYPIANRFIRAWELPPSVSSDPGNWSADISSSEPSQAPPSRPRPGDYHLVGNTRQTFIG
ncbi:hypothetical protein PVAP13_6KG341100 [Panicum virgatum]|uniref:DUF1618 domain-containing protein n=1 Tax=Panicum virgatum TaxID=38727 RepID=A0A8T0RH60_PANVG|nr:hypothetical protein PVAP13_6KG341100 [Panicum virgatum]